MIKLGEMSGSLTKSLEQAVKYLEDVDNTGSNLTKIIIPNVLQLVAIIGILIFGVAYIIPLIQEAFEASGTTQTLPKITLWFVDFCNGFTKIWYIPVSNQLFHSVIFLQYAQSHLFTFLYFNILLLNRQYFYYLLKKVILVFEKYLYYIVR